MTRTTCSSCAKRGSCPAPYSCQVPDLQDQPKPRKWRARAKAAAEWIAATALLWIYVCLVGASLTFFSPLP